MKHDKSWWLIPFLLILLIARVAFLVFFRIGRPFSPAAKSRTLKSLIVLGSGGHTAEMLNLLAFLDKKRFYPRWYIAAATDNMSLARGEVAEKAGLLEVDSTKVQGAHYLQVFRSREVGQSYLTSIVTTLVAMMHAFWLICKIRPDVILCNGPGTCIPLCVAGFLLHVFGLKRVAIFYVESIARVRKLSLSGLLLYKLHLADQLFVQWPQLKQKYPKVEYVGRLM
eukprot:TRINITY_DN38119_c0_g1_i1.p1 TRINITY_DN38119_c0_g1~~TRINITY_DN38119_c0_g1_i1.p1  ORF type:complete len:225 (-),score=27.81 TRINITY_DN38119_c0_g1_i1:145-819(-)